MSLTSIKQLVNKTPYPVFFRKLENAEDTGVIYGTPKSMANYQVSYNEIWLPWCDNQQQLVTKVLFINVYDDVVIYLWQTGNTVYTNQQLITTSLSNHFGPVIYNPPQKPFPQQQKGFTIRTDIFASGKPINGFSVANGNRRLVIERIYDVQLEYAFSVYMEML